MPHWKEEYLTSLKGVEMNNPVNMELVETCSQMADRIAALEAEKASLVSQIPASSASKSSSPAISADGVSAQSKVELAEALRSKGVAESRLRTAEELLGKLRSRTKEDSKVIRELTASRSTLMTRLKDREHEIREKRKLLEDVQDEMITLNLQMSIAEKERDKVKAENKELIDRWMKRMGQEADAMNLANEPLLESPR